MSEEKAKKRQQALAIKRKYDAAERRRNRILWGLLIAVVIGLVGGIGYNLFKPAPGDPFSMPFIGTRHEQLIENNPDRK